MIPFKKLASLFIRTFSKPLSNVLKRYALNNNNSRSSMKRTVRFVFISFGNRYHHFEQFLERAQVGHTNQEIFIKPLTDEAAFIKGTELISDLFVYACVLGLPLYEMIRQSNEADKKQAIQDEKINNLAKEVQQLEEVEEKIREKQQSIKNIDQLMIHAINESQHDFQAQIQKIINELKL